MQKILEMMNSENYILFLTVITVILFIGFIAVMIGNIRLNKKYKKFIKKLGNGENIEEDLERFMYNVNKVEKQNEQIMEYCKTLDNDVSKCIQKVGIVRYNAFRDTGSDLSFTLALLDENNDGVVFNGIYSMEMSNIYAKPVKGGKSNYTLSEEEVEAIDKAINSNNICRTK